MFVLSQISLVQQTVSPLMYDRKYNGITETANVEVITSKTQVNVKITVPSVVKVGSKIKL